MPNKEGRRTDDTRMLITTLAYYLHRGYSLDVQEPPVRGSERASGEARRSDDAIRYRTVKSSVRSICGPQS
jgi:hypothetical protein